MKKCGRIYRGGGSHNKIISYHKKISLTNEKVLIVDREYGMMKTMHSDTPYPQKDKPIDMVALAARLEAEKPQIRVSINANIVMKLSRSDDSQTERLKNFNKRRKLFDEGEFTICKGRKLSDDYHPLKLYEDDLHFKALYTKIVERKSSNSQNFDELAKYCCDNNSELAHH